MNGFARGRTALLVVACIALGGIFGPSLAGAAETLKDVIVRNTDDQPVPTKAIGTTNVAGTVNVGNFPGTQNVHIVQTGAPWTASADLDYGDVFPSYHVPSGVTVTDVVM